MPAVSPFLRNVLPSRPNIDLIEEDAPMLAIAEHVAIGK
jgi:hypothetical protein